ncbi:hypothetical protein NPIL_671591 [Nephila pilipes]|uniref:Uncharacterized protein n=1 Tax=Nephila pilipes TaxID=299642 RepID=A0A8X6TV65_NEPPI|nr:hypothetical protein NPIL_671591 [Nephila pilipes]
MKYLCYLLLFLSAADSSVLKNQRKREIDLSNKNDTSVPENSNTSCNIDCENTLNASEGLIQIPGNSVIHQYELTYKLKIEVPKGHSIDLTFSKLSQESNDTSSCKSCKPSIEIVYYDSSGEPHLRIDSIDNISMSTNMSIPAYKADIRFFTGLKWNQSQGHLNNYLVSFKAIPNKEGWTIFKFMPIVLPLGFIISGVACFW